MSYENRNRLIFATGISLILVPVLFMFSDVERFLDVWRSITPLHIATVLCSTAAAYALRAWRFKLTTHTEKGAGAYPDYLAVLSVYNLMTSVLPAGTGELSYAVLMRRFHGVKLASGIASVLVSRLFQALVVISSFLVATLYLDFRDVSQVWGGIRAAIILAIIAIIVFLIMGDRLVKWLSTVTPTKGVMGRAGSFLANVADSLSWLKGQGLYFHLIGLSLLIFICNALSYYFFFRLFGFHISFAASVVVLSMLQAMAVLPIQGLAKFGSYESFFAVALYLVGYETGESIALGFAIHAANLVIQVFLALPGAVQIWVGERKMNPRLAS